MSLFISVLDVSLLEYLLAKKELSYDEICSNALSLLGAGVDTVSLYELWALCNLKVNSLRDIPVREDWCLNAKYLSDIRAEISEDTVKVQHSGNNSRGTVTKVTYIFSRFFHSVYACVGLLFAAT